MKAQSTDYPVVTQYDSKNIAVPINISQFSKPDQMRDGEIQTGYEYDLVFMPAGSTEKEISLGLIQRQQIAVQEQGFTCSNGIKLQTREEDLIRWTQLTTTLLAFQPAEVLIRDYDNRNHLLPLKEVMKMMGEIAAWEQAALANVWSAKDDVLRSETAAIEPR